MRCCLLFLAWMLASSICGAQPTRWAWAKTGGSYFSDLGGDLAIGKDGSVYNAGDFRAALLVDSFILNDDGYTDHDAYLLKYRSDGTLAWAKTFGGNPGYDRLSAVCVGEDGNLYLAGVFTDSIVLGTTTLYAKGKRDVMLLKMDTAGTVLWALNAGGTGDDEVNLEWQSGGLSVWGNQLTLTGRFDSSAHFSGLSGIDTASVAAPDGQGLFVARYSSSGDLAWVKTIHPNGTAVIADNAMDVHGNVFSTGFFSGTSLKFGSFELDKRGGPSEIFVSKHDSSGNFLWATCVGGNADDVAYALAVDGEGNVIVTGVYFSSPLLFGTASLANAGEHDLFLAKYNPNGGLLWARQIGTSDYELGYSVATDAANNIYLSGFLSALAFHGSSTLPYQPAVAKFDPNGELIWAADTDTGNVEGLSLAVGTDGAVYLSGSYISKVNFGGNRLKSFNGGFDFFIAKLTQESSSVHALASHASSVGLFPNPADAILHVRLPEDWDAAKLSIRDVAGRNVATYSFPQFSAGQLTLDVANLAAGCYFLQATRPDGTTSTQPFTIHR